MKIWSGDVCMGEAGVHVGNGLHTGDIVQLWHEESDGCLYPTDNLTTIVTDLATGEHFVMGIRSVGFEDPKWQIRVVKRWSDAVDGERWPAWGFRYTS